jgi:hypothetical protein
MFLFYLGREFRLNTWIWISPTTWYSLIQLTIADLIPSWQYFCLSLDTNSSYLSMSHNGINVLHQKTIQEG